tara:strand:+ start:1591 stop:2010 length:420 start_codon:yes stop_codon:yes gene_type:complete
MAVIAQSARYGSGLFGVSKFGVTNLSKTLTGVAGTTNTPSITQTHTSTVVLIDRFTVQNKDLSATGLVGNVETFTFVTPLGVSAVGGVGSVTINNTESLASVQGTTAIGTVSTTAVVFNYGAVRDLYDRRRTVNIERAA